MAATCSKCGGDVFSPGALISAVRTSFRPQDSKFLTLETGDVMTKAEMCRNCGLVTIVGDANKLKRLTSDLTPRESSPPRPRVPRRCAHPPPPEGGERVVDNETTQTSCRKLAKGHHPHR